METRREPSVLCVLFYLQSGFLSLFSFENISQQKKLKIWNTLQIHTFLPRIKGVNVFKDYGSNITSICIPRILKSICSVFQIFNFLCCEIFSEEKRDKKSTLQIFFNYKHVKEERRNSCPSLNTTKEENAFSGDNLFYWQFKLNARIREYRVYRRKLKCC